MTNLRGKSILHLLLVILVLFIIFGPLSSLVIWSIAEEWFWPNAFPTEIGMKYWQRAMSGNIFDSFTTSFYIAVLVTVVCMLITVPVAYLIARKRIPFRTLLLLIFLIPQAFPQLPVYTNTMRLMYKWDLVGTIPGVMIIHLVGGIVYSVWILVSVFKSIQPHVEEAAYVLGASKIQTFLTISLPMALPGIISSSLLVFLFSLDEFTGSLLIGAPFISTMPIYMYNAANGYEMQIASVIAIILMIPGLILLLIIQKYMKAEYLSAFGRS